MPRNVGKTDKTIRVILAIILIILGWPILKNNWLGFICNIVASYLLLTSLTGTCWIYAKLKRSTLSSSATPPPPINIPPQNFPPQ